MAYIHIIDDNPQILDFLSDFLELEGYEVSTFPSAEDALSVIALDTPDIILLDLKLPGIDGLEYLGKVKKQYPKIEVIIVTGHADVTTAIQAIKFGAYDYIKKPIDLKELGLLIQKAVTEREKVEQLADLQKEKQYEFKEIIASSKAMEKVFEFIRQVADSPKTTVLICGKTGTGKELVARAIHYNSKRANKPFIEINCSALPESLLESELFGYEAGSFTDAKRKKQGLLEIAHEGTFFFDEIADMSLKLQAKLLKVIEEKTFRRVGGTKEIKIDLRIISASSRNLTQRMMEGKFREDLYYRLDVVMIELPPLRNRDKDVILLAKHFITRYNAEFKHHIKGMNSDVKALLLQHSWPGNVRELRNVIERSVLFEKGEYLSLDSVSLVNLPRVSLPLPVSLQQGLMDFEIPPEGLSITDVEKSLIEKALLQTNGNQTKAAKLLRISRETLKYRSKKFKIL